MTDDKFKVLGSGGWEGIPAPFCRCRICQEASEQQHASKNYRMRPGFFAQTSTSKAGLIIDPGFDLRLQVSRFELPVVTNFLISHWHPDHMWGLFELASWARNTVQKKLSLYGSYETGLRIKELFAHLPHTFHEIEPFVRYVVDGVEFTAFPVYHMAQSDESRARDKDHNVFGFLFDFSNKKIAYLADYYALTQETQELLQQADVIIADGTYLLEGSVYISQQQEAQMGDSDHLHGEAIFSLLERFPSASVFFHSITHLSGLTHDELVERLAHRFQPAFDGMNILPHGEV